jgi:2-iminoacetate synthase ThiH
MSAGEKVTHIYSTKKKQTQTKNFQVMSFITMQEENETLGPTHVGSIY